MAVRVLPRIQSSASRNRILLRVLSLVPCPYRPPLSFYFSQKSVTGLASTAFSSSFEIVARNGQEVGTRQSEAVCDYRRLPTVPRTLGRLLIHSFLLFSSFFPALNSTRVGCVAAARTSSSRFLFARWSVAREKFGLRSPIVPLRLRHPEDSSETKRQVGQGFSPFTS